MEDVGTEPSIQELNAEIADFFLRIREVTAVLFLSIRQKFIQTGVVLCMIALLFWVAIFLYGSFHYSFMPTANFITPVHFYYRTDCPSAQHSVCSLPTANFSLLRNSKKQVMTYGQPYHITLELEMPESPANEQLGMFLVKMTCYSHEGQIVDSSARSAMLRYRSGLLQSLGTLALLPLLLTGATEQKQQVLVEIYSSYVDSSYKPTTGAVIEIYSEKVQIYNAYLYIHAHYTGIRYMLYHFPLASAVVGVASNFTFLCILILITYLKVTLDGLTNPQVVNWNRIRLSRAGTIDQYHRTTPTEDHSADTKTNLQETSVMGSGDMKNSGSSRHMEESILDTRMEREMNDPTGFPEGQSVPRVVDMDVFLKHRFLSEGPSGSSLPFSDQDNTCCHSGPCLS
ncbi:BSCL2 lipid droplet biogenesis associated, seipin, like isoform X2 [Brachyhypopomus gauderio]|uniref:BSCL2 lipid droplet biogenesis associated, seipin, like isoform X2 n=1 Tax=Brachyhypopomus gauderio TaxID=698409 RepID=UPI0040428ABA